MGLAADITHARATRTAIAILLSGTGGLPLAHALEVESLLRVGVGESDNITRSSTDPIEETVRDAGMTLNLTQDSRTLSVILMSDIDYVDYKNEIYESQWQGFASLLADYSLVEDTLNWILQYDYGQQVFDPLSAPNPGNREDINYWTTGPSLSFQLGDRHGVGADITYSSIRYEVTPSDNERTYYGVWFARQLNEEARISLNLSTNEIEYDAPTTDGYDVNEAFIRYESTNTRNILVFDAGVTEVDIPGLGGTGHLVRMEWTRTISAASSLSVATGSQFSNNGDIFRFLQLNTPRSTDALDVPTEDQPFRFNYGYVNYISLRGRNSIELSAGVDEEKFENMSDEDRLTLRATFSISRDISRSFFIDLYLRYEQRDFDSISRKDDDLFASLILGYELGSRFTVEIGQQFAQRKSSEAGRDFEENRTMLRLTYRPPWSL